jgi:hypothetical protein
MIVEAARQALYLLEEFVDDPRCQGQIDATSIALRQAIEQAEKQEPVAWFSPSGNLYRSRYHAVANGEQVVTPLYTNPPTAPAQEPIAWIERDMMCDEFDPASVTCKKSDTATDGWEWVPLVLATAPVQEKNNG